MANPLLQVGVITCTFALVAGGVKQGSPPLRGWMSWEKYTCETDCDHFPETCIGERLLLTTVDAMVEEGFVDAGYDTVNLDDCWLLAARDDNGDLQYDPKRFPRGIKFIADYVHSKGMKFGMYNDVGGATCCGLAAFSISAVPDEQADAQLQRDVELMMSWGMDAIKVDGCNSDYSLMNITYPKLGVALADAAAKLDRPAPWYSCSWPFYVALQTGSWVEPFVPWHEIAARCDSARIFYDIGDTWQDSGAGVHGVKDIIDFYMKNPQLAEFRNSLAPGTRYYHDADMLMIGNNGLSESLAQVQMAMWVMFASPLIMSTEIRNGSMKVYYKAILLNEEVLVLADDPLGRQATLCTSGCSQRSLLYGGTATAWNKTLADGSVAVALLNTGNFGSVGPAFGSFNINFTADAVGLSCPAAFTARDLFNHRDLGTFSDSFSQEVDESSVTLLRLHCVQHTKPLLIVL